MLRSEIVDRARSWCGTRFRHQGRSARGIDCAGLVVLVAQSFGLPVPTKIDYGRIPDGSELQGFCERFMRPASPNNPGAVLLFRFTSEPQHLAIRTDVGLVHAYERLGECRETGYGKAWANRLVAAYDFPGVE